MAIFSAIAYGIGYAVGFLGAAAGLSTTMILTLASAATGMAASAAFNALKQALAPKISVPTQEVQAVINQDDASRRVYVGRNLVGGVRAAFDVHEGQLFQPIVAAHGRIDGFEEFRIDGEPVTLTDGVVTGGEKDGYVTVRTRDGSAQGGDYAEMQAAFGYWTAERRLQDQATFLVMTRAPKAEDFMKVFPKAHNTVFQWVARGRRIHDPRTLENVWSDNAALVIAHYLRDPDGFRLLPGDIDWDSVGEMADVSDIAVPQQLGGTAPSLRLWGHWTLDEEPSAVLDRMATSSGIRAYETQSGKIGLIGGPYGEPACTLTNKDILEIRTSEAISEREGYNVLQIHYMSAQHNFTVIEVDSWMDQDRLDVEGEISQEMRMEMCPNRSQGRRRGKQQRHDDNRGRVDIITNLVGLKARYPKRDGQRHTILLDFRPEDGSGRVIEGEFEVLDHEFDPVRLNCRIKLATVNRVAAQGWDPEEEGSVPELPTEMGGDAAPPLVAVLSQRITGPVAVLRVEAELPPGDRLDLGVQAQYRLLDTTIWSDMTGTGLVAESGVVQDGATYEVRARMRGIFAGPAPWVHLGNIQIQVDSTAPAAPTALQVSAGGGGVQISWRNPNSHFASARIYRGTTSVFASASLIDSTGGAAGQISEAEDDAVLIGETYYYWVAAANVSGVVGPPAGPASITV